MSFDIPKSLVARSVSCRRMTPEECQRIYDTLPGGPSYIDDVSSFPSEFQSDYEEEDAIFADAADALSHFPLPKCNFLSPMSSVDYDSLSRGPPKRETIEDYCFGMDFDESFVPAALSVLQRPLPVPCEDYRYDLPLRRLEPTHGTVEHKEYMYDAISSLLEKTQALNREFADNTETKILCQNVQQILENWGGFDVVSRGITEAAADYEEYDEEYDSGNDFYTGGGEEEEEEEEEEEDDGFQEPTEYEKENENELYMWGGLK
jgi:hypothetical protein